MTNKEDIVLKNQITWVGEVNRPLTLFRPCECGCDLRYGNTGVGFLTASDPQGNGFTIWIESEEVFQGLAREVEEY